MSYKVLARRYRPETFDDVVGQESVARTLKNAIATDRVAHAYLFTGTRGVGKTTMARILAKALNCLAFDKPTPDPCCKCASCVAISEGDDIDVLEIDGASNTGVDHIRELRQNAIYRPGRSRMKIYIIDEVHMLSRGAFNALLKTLEEPPEHVKFIFATTEPNKILPTIQSRCQRFDFRSVQLDDIASHLANVLKGEGVEADEAVVRRVARHGRGSIRDSLSLLDQLLSMSSGKLTTELLSSLIGTSRSDRVIELVGAIGCGDLGMTLEQVDMAVNEGLALDQLAEALQGHFRDLMVLRNCGGDSELVDADDQNVRAKLTEQSKLFDDAVLVYNITVLEELRRSIKSSGSGRALLEAAIVRLTATDRFADTKVLLEQLQGIQANSGVTRAPASRAAAPASAAPTPATPAANGQSANTAAKAASQQSAGAAPAGNYVAALTVPKDISIEYLHKNWTQIVSNITHRDKNAKHLSMYLRAAKPELWQDGMLTISYPPGGNGMRKLLTDQPEYLGQASRILTAILGRNIKLELSAESAEQVKNGVSEGGSGAGGPLQAPGAKPSQQEINTVMNDPQVKNIQTILGGKVMQIQRKTK